MTRPNRYALCIENRGFPAALHVRNVYRLLSDPQAEKRGLVRMIDESDEDCLYPEGFFVPIEVARKAARVFLFKSA